MVKPQKSVKFSGSYVVCCILFLLFFLKLWLSQGLGSAGLFLTHKRDFGENLTQTSNRYITNVPIFKIAYDNIKPQKLAITVHHHNNYGVLSDFYIFCKAPFKSSLASLWRLLGEMKTKIARVQEILRGHDRSCLGRRFQQVPKTGSSSCWLWMKLTLRDFRFKKRRDRLDLYRGLFCRVRNFCGGRECDTKTAALESYMIIMHGCSGGGRGQRQIRFTLGHKTHRQKELQCAGGEEACHSP